MAGAMAGSNGRRVPQLNREVRASDLSLESRLPSISLEMAGATAGSNGRRVPELKKVLFSYSSLVGNLDTTGATGGSSSRIVPELGKLPIETLNKYIGVEQVIPRYF